MYLKDIAEVCAYITVEAFTKIIDIMTANSLLSLVMKQDYYYYSIQFC